MWLDDLLRNQRGVISRAQARACGLADHDIRRLLRRREWAPVLPGVYIHHTGPTTWEQRAMAGVLHGATLLDHDLRPVGAALAGHAALRSAIGPGWRTPSAVIEVAIDVNRRRGAVRGYRFSRVTDLAAKTDDVRTPPRLRLPEALADLAIDAGDELEVVQTVADACQSRMVSARDVLGARAPVRPRRGPCSRAAHARAAADQDRRRRGGRHEYRDCEWQEDRLVVELDGRQFHDNPRQRDRDLDRDLDDAADGRHAVRLGWGQATRRRCRTARRLAAILRAPATPCADCQ